MGRESRGSWEYPDGRGPCSGGWGAACEGPSTAPYQAVLHREVELLLGQPLQLLQEVQVVRGVRLFVCEDFGGLRKSGEG